MSSFSFYVNGKRIPLESAPASGYQRTPSSLPAIRSVDDANQEDDNDNPSSDTALSRGHGEAKNRKKVVASGSRTFKMPTSGPSMHFNQVSMRHTNSNAICSSMTVTPYGVTMTTYDTRASSGHPSNYSVQLYSGSNARSWSSGSSARSGSSGFNARSGSSGSSARSGSSGSNARSGSSVPK